LLRRLLMFTMRQYLLIALSMFVVLCCEVHSFGQSDASELLDRKLTIHVSQATLIYVIDTLAVRHGIPVGLEKFSTHKDEAKIDIDIEEGALREVLDSMVRQEPSYRWQVIDGVINFTPTHDRDGFVATFLDTPVNRFASGKGNDELDIRDRILKLSTVRRLMTSYGMGVDRLWGRGVYAENEVDLSISNTNVRGVLNKVIRDSKYKTWVVELTGKNKENLLVSF
ncbi:MAG: hypothetical protein MN733_05005, partial [Nitrososphaera sp.]|nr:hypothetical protein [Nitrososphaera sp.]